MTHRDDADATLVQLALDGSWDSPGQTGIFAYGGVAGLQSNWAVHAELWNSVLAKYDLRSFHMAEAMNFRGQFERLGREWGERRIQKRDALLSELVEVAVDPRVGVTLASFASNMSLLPEKQRAAKKKSIFQAVIKDFVRTMRDDHLIGVMCDREQDAAGLFLGWFENLRQRDAVYARRIWMIAFVDDKWVPAVQLADLWTYLHRQDVERRLLRVNEAENQLFVKLRDTCCGEQSSGYVTRDDFASRHLDE